MKTFDPKQLAIIIPSYNDVDNLPLVIESINTIAPLSEIIVVDDSANEEKKKLPALKKQFPNISILERKKKSGRGSAVLEGFRHALKNKHIEYVLEMDADTSHDPKDLPSFFAEREHADVIVGSRYLKDSKVINWPKKRLFLSRMINKMLLNNLLGLGLHDYTNGYRMYNRRAAEFLLTAPLHETGFLLLSETAYLLRKTGFTLKEVPITFTDRKFGKSSVKFTDLLENFFGAFRIRFANS
ncbi:MAG: glycosyltransferase [Patescibacteria group bacterium]|nr:glycosyltransferase [Patescibacteria group bacterium]